LSPEGGIGGYPVKVPQVRVHTIGAGGGSIERPVLGTLKVGPQSAGAEPGPVCYGAGGTEPTSTDAALCLGYIDPEYFLGGEMALDVAGARTAIDEKIAKPLRLSLDEAMLAIVKIQVSTIVAGIRAVSVEAGHDPREFALLPFGGAGGLYAGLIAEDANIGRVLVPSHPSVLSALGMLMTDIRHDLAVTRLMALDDQAPAQIGEICRELTSEAERRLAADRVTPNRIRLEASCDLRYVGQAYEINVPLPGTAPDFRCNPDALRRSFHDEHRRVYGHAAEDELVEIVNVRMAGIGIVDKAELVRLPGEEKTLPRPKGHRRALFDLAAGWQDCPVYEREGLPVGATLTGPAIVEERGASIPIYPGHRLTVDGYGNIIVDVRTAAAGAAQRVVA
jgi:N-methylhydantoinase A